MSEKECRSRWKSLRDVYVKEKKKDKEKRRSGAEAPSQHQWRYMAVMGFLAPFIQCRPTMSNLPRRRQSGPPQPAATQAALPQPAATQAALFQPDPSEIVELEIGLFPNPASPSPPPSPNPPPVPNPPATPSTSASQSTPAPTPPASIEFRPNRKRRAK